VSWKHDPDFAADADGAGARSAMLVINGRLHRVRRRPKCSGGAGVIAVAAAGDGEAVMQSRLHDLW
jgi:hypothetical protein